MALHGVRAHSLVGSELLLQVQLHSSVFCLSTVANVKDFRIVIHESKQELL